MSYNIRAHHSSRVPSAHCSICHEDFPLGAETPKFVIYPCGHSCCHRNCSDKVSNTAHPKCPTCAVPLRKEEGHLVYLVSSAAVTVDRTLESPIMMPAGANPKTIIVFGETGAGKSSLVNMLTGREDARTGNDAVGVTFNWTKHSANVFDTQYHIFDTVGLNEGHKGTAKGKDAIINLFKLVESLENGVNLLVFCMRGRIKKTTSDNYKLFYRIFCDSKVPIILVVTGLELLEEDELDTWWTRNRTAFEGYGMKFDGWVCGTTTEGKRHMYAKEFNATKQQLFSLVNIWALDEPWHKPPITWWSGIIRVATKLLPTVFGNLSWSFRTIRDALLSVGGYSPCEADEIARRTV